MSTHSEISIPSGASVLTDHGISDQRAASLQTLWRSMYDLCVAFRAQASDTAGGYGLSNPQFTVFMVVSAGQPMTMGQIGEQSDLPTSSLTALVDRLAELGLVSRNSHPSDRRALQVQLTASGQELASRVAADTLWTTAQITSAIDDSRLEQTSAAIHELLDGYQQHVARSGRAGSRSASRRAVAGRASSQGVTKPDHTHDRDAHRTMPTMPE